MPKRVGLDIIKKSKILKNNAGNWLRKYTNGILTRAQYVILPILFEYSLSRKAVATHNRIKDRIEVTMYPLLRAVARWLAAIGLVIAVICDSPKSGGIPGDII
ncbi:MAG: hypothetical protein WBL49_13865 [Nitrososphaeraceae archaeon]